MSAIQCPVCEKGLANPLPTFCGQCGWDLENDLTLTPSLDKIPENVQSKYEQRLDIVKRVWSKRGVPEEKAKEYFESAEIAYEKGDYERAIADYTQAIAINAGYGDAYFNRGVAFYRIGCYEQSIEDYRTAIAINPDYTKAYYKRGFIYYRSGDYERAIWIGRSWRYSNYSDWYSLLKR